MNALSSSDCADAVTWLCLQAANSPPPIARVAACGQISGQLLSQTSAVAELHAAAQAAQAQAEAALRSETRQQTAERIAREAAAAADNIRCVYIIIRPSAS